MAVTEPDTGTQILRLREAGKPHRHIKVKRDVNPLPRPMADLW